MQSTLGSLVSQKLISHFDFIRVATKLKINHIFLGTMVITIENSVEYA